MSLVAMVALGCSSLVANTRHDPNASFSGRTYFIDSWEESPYPLPNQVRPLIEAAIVRELNAKGFTQQSTPEAAAIVVSYAIGGRKKHIFEPWKHDSARIKAAIFKNARFNKTRISSLAIYLADGKTQKYIWAGLAEDTGEWKDVEDRVDAAVAKLFADFPPE